MNERVYAPSRQIARYRVSDNEMAAGSTFGSPRAMLRIKPTGAIEKLFAPELGCDVFGPLVFHHWDAKTGVPLAPRRGTFDIFPEHQTHEFALSNGVDVKETIFLLSGQPKGADHRDVDPPGAYYKVELTNNSDREWCIGTYASMRLRGGVDGNVSARFDPHLPGFVAVNDGDPSVVRIAACDPRPRSAEATLDTGKTSAATFPGELSGDALETDENVIGILHFETTLRPQQSTTYTIVLTFSEKSESDAYELYRALPDVEEAYTRTCRYFTAMMGRAIILTPDEEVNRGVQWAKANILRVQSLTAQGWCFVNDPTRSNNSVARDTAWYAMGADHVTPIFTRDALLWYIEHLEERGMVVEYFDIRNGKTEDYGLNINDDTPLLIIALWHHYCATGDRAFLERIWPNAQRAAQYMLSQRNDQGLVWCSADGQADWGIIGWRNVIKGYRLSGATTEANSECYGALVTMAKMARELGDDAKAAEYQRCAEDLKRAINEHLLDRSRNLYYLNIDITGNKRTDVTADLVFPVLFGVADHEVASNIISRLSSQEFWSDAGIHTVPRTCINYSPTNGYGLFGGVWSGPTFWYATAASEFNPDFMAYALSASFRHYTTDPLRNNTVPGQFCEWLHGETLTNQGMMLSPWFAPKYLWAALEGAAGLDITSLKPKLEPRLPTHWQWLAVRNISVRGKETSWITVRADEPIVYSTYAFEDFDEEYVYDEDVSDEVSVSGDAVVCVALRRANRIVIFLGNTFERSVNVSITSGLARNVSLLRRYNTLRSEWVEDRSFDVRAFRDGVQVELSRHGFAVLELHTAA